MTRKINHLSGKASHLGRKDEDMKSVSAWDSQNMVTVEIHGSPEDVPSWGAEGTSSVGAQALTGSS